MVWGVLLSLLCLSQGCRKADMPRPSVTVSPLNSNASGMSHEWQFQYRGRWYPATVPGNIHDDLLQNKLIPDPFFGTNEDSVQWVGDSSWSYRLYFDGNCADHRRYAHRQLVFEGLDTYAEVYLNGKHLVDVEDKGPMATNMFRQWVYDLPNDLKERNNELIVRFLPSAAMEKRAAEKLPYALPDSRAFSRKAQFESGWDWGPKLITCGIWKDVYIRSWEQMRLADVYVYDTQTATDGTRPWHCEVEVTVEADKPAQAHITVEVTDDRDTHLSVKRKARLHRGLNRISVPVAIERPELWWPDGLGKQHLYRFAVAVSDKLAQTEVEKTVNHGLRTIELRQEKDEIGQSFEFYVNGKPVFMRGTNWIPASSFPGTLNRTEGNEIYYRLLSDCKEVNMNMIRVWGGGIYENDRFYDYCDRFGILVWQDFMFAGSLCPADDVFLQNVQKEAVAQVVRLRNHACMALWCGNNEVHNGWEDWGWQEQYSDAQRKQLYADYQNLFEKILPSAVRSYHRTIAYVPSSPLYGWGHEEACTHGDSHYWGVWWGELPFSVWPEKTGRFMSEYGFQAYPDMSTIARFTHSDERNLNSPALKNHQKHARGVPIIRKTMASDFGYRDTTNLDDFVYVSQLVQAAGITKAIEAHRVRHRHCRGTLYWQLNDCWPVASWSSIDCQGHWKALHYRLREVYANIAVAIECNADKKAHIYLINDSLADVKGDLRWELFTLDGKRIAHRALPDITSSANSAHCAAVCDIDEIARSQNRVLDTNNIFLKVQYLQNGRVRAEKVSYFTLPRHLHLTSSPVRQEISQKENVIKLTLSSPVLQLGVFVTDTSGNEIRWSDNYFDLLPNEPKTIYGYCDHAQSSLPSTRTTSYNGIKRWEDNF